MHPHQPKQPRREAIRWQPPRTTSSTTSALSPLRSLLLATLAAGSVACTGSVTSLLDEVDHRDERRGIELDADPGAGAGGEDLGDVDWGGQGANSSGPAGSGGQGATLLPDPQPSRLVEVPLGEVPVGQSTPFHITPETLGFTAIIHSPSESGTVGLERLEAPGGELLVDDFLIEQPAWEVWWYGTTVASVPQSDGPSAMPQVMPGPWSLQVADRYGSAQSAEVSVWRRETSDGAYHGGWLDINVLIAGEATTESYLRPVLEQAFHGYAGLHLGEVEFFEIGAEYGVVDEYNFDQVVRQTAMVATAPALNVIVIADFTGWLEGAAGVAAGIPGQGIEHGTNASAVLLESFGDPGLEIDVLRHEAGHLAGLFHTTEIDELGVDPLGDTPECSDVLGLLYDCPDAANLMFPIVMSNSPAFTAKQHRVIEGSSLYRAELVDAAASAAALDESIVDPVEHDPGIEAGHGMDRHAPGHGSSERAPHRQLGAWAAGLEPAVGQLLAGGWCAHQPQGAPRVGLDDALGQLGADPARLLAVGANARAPAHARKRALRAAARLLANAAAGEHEGTVAMLAALAQDGSQPTAVRLGALGALQRLAPERRQSLARALRNDGDPLVAMVATQR